MSLNEEIRQLIAKIVKLPQEKVINQAELFSELGVDSMTGVEIFAALDQKYNLNIPENKLRDVKTVADLVALVEQLKQ